jgi:hypothetical protein
MERIRPTRITETLTAGRLSASPSTTALDIARLTSNAFNLFPEQNEKEQRRLLTMILKQATWQDGGLRTIRSNNYVARTS